MEKETNESVKKKLTENSTSSDFQYSDFFMFPHVLSDQKLSDDGSEIPVNSLKK